MSHLTIVQTVPSIRQKLNFTFISKRKKISEICLCQCLLLRSSSYYFSFSFWLSDQLPAHQFSEWGKGSIKTIKKIYRWIQAIFQWIVNPSVNLVLSDQMTRKHTNKCGIFKLALTSLTLPHLTNHTLLKLNMEPLLETLPCWFWTLPNKFFKI
jgi:hypothetical protein